MIDKDKTRVDISLGDYERLQKEIEAYRKLLEELTSSKYAEYKVDDDYTSKPFEEGRKYCEFKFDAKRFIKDNYRYFAKDSDWDFRKMDLKLIELIIKD